MISPRLGVLRNRINEKRELNANDVALVEEAAEYIRRLESRIAVLLDKIEHPKTEKSAETY